MEIVAQVIPWVIGALSTFVAAATVKNAIVIVKEKTEAVIETFGKYSKTYQTPGLHFKIPFLQKVANRVPLAIIEMKEDLKTKTKDDIFMTLPVKMHFQIIDTKKFQYESRDPMSQVMSRVAATVKQETTKFNFQQLYQERQEISESVRQNVGQELENLYGVKLIDVIVDEPHAPSELQNSYNDAKASAQRAVATKNNAEAAKAASIAEAEGRKEALRLDGEGIAAQRAAIFKNYAEQFNELSKGGLSTDQVYELVLKAMDNDTKRDLGKHGNTIIIDGTNGQSGTSPLLAALKAANAGGGKGSKPGANAA